MKALNFFLLDGKVALVTGGAGRYGRFIVEALAEAGATTYIASRSVEKCHGLADELSQKGYKVLAGQLDQASEVSARELYRRILEEQGKIDILVNNAVSRPMKGYDDPIESFAESMEVNATGVFMLTRIFSQNMVERRQGSIINIASIQGVVGPDFSLYEGTEMDAPPDYFFHKAGMINLTRYLAAKLGPYGVRVNAISPGGLFANQNPAFVERYSKRTFLGRMAGGEEIKGAVVFFASDASSYITGANLMVDGGYTAK
ncbi:MAG: SDR family oxidoreductase [Firmicutes bacterium]|nr:SDR family oxidoreductase [Bacillota bacterium]